MARWSNLLALIIFMISVLLACNWFGDIYVFIQQYFASRPNADLVIGILSARDHFAQRQVLRDTWVGNIRNKPDLNQQIQVKFLVGSEACAIPTEYRTDHYGCNQLNISYNEQGAEEHLQAFRIRTTNCNIGEIPRNNGPLGFDFKVHHAIVVDKLGVYEGTVAGGLNRPKKVILYDTWRQEPIAISHFSPEQPGILIDGFRFRPVQPYILPKNFEGSIIVEGVDDTAGICMLPTDSEQGLITLKQFNRYGTSTGSFPSDIERLLPGTPYQISGNIIYHIHDPKALSTWRNNREKEMAKHLKVTTNETSRLHEEVARFNDIILLDVVDTYRNIPKKMIQFYKWVDNTMDFKFVIKTDDDCFLNVQNILQGILSKELDTASKTWWGNFRINWAVNHDGKWAELEYPCSGYPAFACGSGSLLTADVVWWIAHNERYLHSYQGEDTSLGIWLSSILPSYDHDIDWICDDTCQPDMYVSAEHSPDELRTMWKHFLLCGDPCNCDDDKDKEQNVLS